MKTVLILSNDSAYTYDLRKEIIKKLLQYYKVYVAVPDGNKIDLLKKMGCNWINVKLDKNGKNPFHDFRLIQNYKKIIKAVKPDIMLSYTIKPNVYGGLAASYFKTPYIANITGLGTAIECSGMLQKITISLHRIAFRKVSCVMFQNKENMDFFKRRHICKAPYVILPGSGVNVEEYKYISYPENTETYHFLFISRIIKEKGIEEYVAAAKKIKEKYPNTRFHILGSCDNQYKQYLKQQEQNGIISYHGAVNDVIPYIKKCHCLIHPSYYPEGMSNVCLESAASGRPVITTNRSGCRETVENNVTGYVVEIQNAEALAQAIEKFIDLPHEEKIKMGQAGRKRMTSLFDRQKIVDIYMNKIKFLIANTE